MKIFTKVAALITLSLMSLNNIFAIEQSDRDAIQDVIKGIADSWNLRDCKGFADGYAEDADFVNIFGMHFKGRNEIEERHLRIMQSFLKGSTFEPVETELREVRPDVVLAFVKWRVQGFRTPATMSQPATTREGIFTFVFVNNDKKWEITTSQNTLIAN